MPKFIMSLSPNFECNVQYTQSTGKVTGLQVINTTGGNAFAQATLTDGRVFGQVFGPGTTNVNFPNNAVSVTIDANGDPTWTGLAGVETRVPA